ncbi:hypothetical protein LWI29_018559 [Acer saccharum]|uniref:Uncharacterized protein n=1 Tax=Acer saccharum TaxID=4024 RepID=A0AA39SH12_ACESA|nr:hypothetical protein LWI29_018559 [Acer saccharum]
MWLLAMEMSELCTSCSKKILFFSPKPLCQLHQILHYTAAMLGHTGFAKLVISRNPELSRELNHQGYTPIHLASCKGHLQIVTELLNSMTRDSAL